jgi:hypothetical protein
MTDELKRAVDALVDAQKQIEAMSTDQRAALGEALATALRQASMLHVLSSEHREGLAGQSRPIRWICTSALPVARMTVSRSRRL